MDRDDQAQALEVLGFAVAHRRRAEQELAAADQAVTELVAKARAAGVPWHRIADLLGRRRQNVERTYRPLIVERRVVTVRPTDDEQEQ